MIIRNKKRVSLSLKISMSVWMTKTSVDPMPRVLTQSHATRAFARKDSSPVQEWKLFVRVKMLHAEVRCL